MNEIKIKNNFFLFFPFFTLTARDVNSGSNPLGDAKEKSSTYIFM